MSGPVPNSTLLWARQIVWRAARLVLLLVGSVWTTCYGLSESASNRFDEDIENIARWSHMYSQEEVYQTLQHRALERGLAIDSADVTIRESNIYIRVNYHASYNVGPFKRTYLFEKRAAAPAVALR